MFFRRQTVLQFVNDWNYEKGNLHLPDICGPEINRLQVARLFNDLLRKYALQNAFYQL